MIQKKGNPDIPSELSLMGLLLSANKDYLIASQPKPLKYSPKIT